MTKDEIIKDLFDLVKVAYDEGSENIYWKDSQSFKDLDYLKFKYKQLIEKENEPVELDSMEILL